MALCMQKQNNVLGPGDDALVEPKKQRILENALRQENGSSI